MKTVLQKCTRKKKEKEKIKNITAPLRPVDYALPTLHVDCRIRRNIQHQHYSCQRAVESSQVECT